MKLKTINVIETVDADAPTIHAFTADDKGREQAKELFRKIAREQTHDAKDLGEVLYEVTDISARDFNDGEIEEAISSGHGLNNADGTWTLQIIESEWSVPGVV